MPRFFLNQRTADSYIEDLDGEDFTTLADAKREAVDSAREIIADRVKSGKWPFASEIEITDEHGKLIATVPFSEVLGEETILPPKPDTSWTNKG